MKTILETIANYTRTRVQNDKARLDLDQLRDLARAKGPADGSAFEEALKKPKMSFICEIKRASPSKGIISEDFPYLEIARDYEQAGAEAISCLTEPKWFLGSDKIFKDIRANVAIPMLRKDFVVDEYQIYQARLLGASAILLICSILDKDTIAKYLDLADRLGLAALVEAHDEAEVKSAISAGARIIGVNNRNLKDFSVDTDNSIRLRQLVPDDIVFVAESGIKSREDVRLLETEGVDAILIGETLMRAQDKKMTLARLRGDL